MVLKRQEYERESMTGTRVRMWQPAPRLVEQVLCGAGLLTAVSRIYLCLLS